MRTPWRFLSDLVSRNPSDKDPEAKDVESEVPAIQHQPVEDVEAVAQEEAIDFTASQDEADDRLDVVVGRGVGHAQDEVSDGGVDKDANAFTSQANEADIESASEEGGTHPDHGEDGSVSETPSAETAGPQPIDAVFTPEAVSAATLTEAGLPTKSELQDPVSKKIPVGISQAPEVDPPESAPRTLYEEMSNLDAEIGELRQALASKLLEQNEQIRRLLRRYPD